MRKPLIALVLAAGLGVASLTGCTSSAPAATPTADPTQTAADSCIVVRDHASKLQQDLASAQQKAATGDFAQAVEELSALRQTFTDAGADVSDSRVKDALTEFGNSIDAFTQIFSGVSNGDLTALTAKGQEFADAGAAMQAAGEKLRTVCAF